MGFPEPDPREFGSLDRARLAPLVAKCFNRGEGLCRFTFPSSFPGALYV